MAWKMNQTQQNALPKRQEAGAVNLIQRKKELISKRLMNMSALNTARQKRLASEQGNTSIREKISGGSTSVYMNPYASRYQI
jgi:hypothetical protein